MGYRLHSRPKPRHHSTRLIQIQIQPAQASCSVQEAFFIHILEEIA